MQQWNGKLLWLEWCNGNKYFYYFLIDERDRRIFILWNITGKWFPMAIMAVERCLVNKMHKFITIPNLINQWSNASLLVSQSSSHLHPLPKVMEKLVYS